MKTKKVVRDTHSAISENTLQKTAAPGGFKWLIHPATHVALILIVGFIAYSNSFTVPFLWDDVTFTEEEVVKNLSRFFSSEGYAYNPRRFVAYLTFALNYHFDGMNVVGYHAVNLAIHLMTACLVYVFVRITLRAPFFARTSPISESTIIFIQLFAALLFVAHPIQTQAVTYLVQRLASLATFFFLAAVVSYVKARLVMVENGERLRVTGEDETANAKSAVFLSGRVIGWFSLALACSLLGMRTKEITATLPLVILLYEFSFFGVSERKKRLLFLAPILLTILVIPVSLALSGRPLGELLSDVDQHTRLQTLMPRSVYLLTQCSVIATYLRLLLLPVNQNLDYDYPLFSTFLAPPVMVGFLLICALLSLAVWLYRKSDSQPFTIHHSPSTGHLYRLIAFGIFWFFITLLVESSIIPIVDVIFEHRLYLPTIGIFIACAAGGALLMQRLPSLYTWITVAAIIIALTGATTLRNRVWQTPISLWSDVTAKSPGKDRPHDNLGRALTEQGLMEEALVEFKNAVMINPGNSYAHYNLASTLDLLGRSNEAIPHFLRALELDPTLELAENNLAIAYLAINQIDEAIVHFRQAVKLNPAAPNFRNNLGDMLRAYGSLEEAIQHLQKAVELAPDYAKAQHNLGMALRAAGNLPQGAFHLKEAVRLAPDKPEYQAALEAASAR